MVPPGIEAFIVGYIAVATWRPIHARGAARRKPMRVSDILRVKGDALYTVPPDQPVAEAVRTMVELDVGSMVVMERGELVGLLTFREVLLALAAANGQLGDTLVRAVMNAAPLTCSPDVEIDEVRRMMLARHARYMPVMVERVLTGVISFYDVAKAVVDGQNLENKLLKAYIRDWPEDAAGRTRRAGDDQKPLA
jgi:CBS domain-containing protein